MLANERFFWGDSKGETQNQKVVFDGKFLDFPAFRRKSFIGKEKKFFKKLQNS